VINFQGTHITRGTRCEKEFHRLSPFGYQEMDFQTLEVALFAGLIPTPRFSLVQMPASDPVIITG
jgi:hypothetical protein